MKLMVADGNRHMRVSGYGALARAILIALKRHADFDLVVERRRGDWDDGVPNREELLAIPEAVGIKDVDAVLRVGSPRKWHPHGRPTLVYTQNALGDLPLDWVEALGEADAVIVPGAFDAVVFRRYFRRVFTCPQFVDPAVFTPVPSYRSEGPDRLSFLFVGSYSYRKGVDLLFPAFAEAFADGRPVHLRLHCASGLEGEGSTHLLRHARQLPANIEMSLFSGTLTPAWMNRHYNRHDAVVSFSRGEGWCMPLHEGLLCGKPVIAPDSTAMGEALPADGVRRVSVRERLISAIEDPFGAGLRTHYGRPGNLFWEVDPQDAVAALRDVADRLEEYRHAAASGRRDILANFTYERMARDLQAAIGEVTGAAGAAGASPGGLLPPGSAGGEPGGAGPGDGDGVPLRAPAKAGTMPAGMVAATAGPADAATGERPGMRGISGNRLNTYRNLEASLLRHFDREFLSSRTFLDFGCGRHGYCLEYRNLFKSGYAVDIQDFSEHYRDDQGITFLMSDGKSIPLKDNSLDFVLSHSALEHVPDLRCTLIEIDRVLKVHGHAYLTVSPLYYSQQGGHLGLRNWEHLDPASKHYMDDRGHGRPMPHNLNRMTVSALLSIVGSLPWSILSYEIKTNGWEIPRPDFISPGVPDLDVHVREFRLIIKKMFRFRDGMAVMR